MTSQPQEPSSSNSSSSPPSRRPSDAPPGESGDATEASAQTLWIWRVLDRLMIRLKRFGRRIDWLPAVLQVVKRMRFPLLFAIAAIFALRTEQGQEVIVNSFDGTLQGLVFVVFCALAAASVWYTSRLLLYTWNESTASVDAEPRSARALRLARVLRRWLPATLGALVMLIPAAGIWSVHDRMPASLRVDARWFALILFGLCVVFIMALLQRQKRLLRAGFSTDRTGLNYRQLDPMAGRFFVMMLALNFAAIVAFAFFPLLPIRLGMGSGVVVMLATGLAIVMGSLVSHISDESKLPILSGLFVAAIFFSLWNDNHRVTTIADRDDASLTDTDIEALSAPLGKSFDAYLDAKLKAAIEARASQCKGRPRERCDPRVPFVIVAAEGGGVRAAAWTALVLSKIDQAAEAAYGKDAFSGRLVAISGVSGGSLGGALYVAARAQGDGASWDTARKFFGTDLLTPMLANMLFVDTPMRFLPASVPSRWVPDRGAAFERTIEHAWSEAVAGDEARDARLFARPFDAMWRDYDPQLPLLVANTTIVASGERMLQSPVILRQATVQTKVAAEILATEETQTALEQDIARDGHSFVGAFDANDCLLPRKGADTGFARLGMPLSAMVHNSARFTWVSPAGRYDADSVCRGVRVVDGGYFENSGTATADDIVWAIHEKYPGKVRTLLVQIRNEPVDENGYRIDCDNLRAAKAESRRGPRLAFSEVFDPLIALFAGRSARADQAKLAMKRRVCGKPLPNETAATVASEANRDDSGVFVEFALLKDDKAGFPLHWAISEDTLSRMEDQFEDPRRPNPRALRALIRALGPVQAVPRDGDPRNPAGAQSVPAVLNSTGSAARTGSSPH
jgi:hypothetical protein